MIEHFCINPNDCFTCRLNREKQNKDHTKLILSDFKVSESITETIHQHIPEDNEPFIGKKEDCPYCKEETNH